MGSRGSPCFSHESYLLSHLNLLAWSDEYFARVCVSREHPLAMVNEHHLTVAAVFFHGSCEDHLAVGAGVNRLSCVCCDVEAAVKDAAAISERRRETTVVNGKPEIACQRILDAMLLGLARCRATRPIP